MKINPYKALQVALMGEIDADNRLHDLERRLWLETFLPYKNGIIVQINLVKDKSNTDVSLDFRDIVRINHIINEAVASVCDGEAPVINYEMKDFNPDSVEFHQQEYEAFIELD